MQLNTIWSQDNEPLQSGTLTKRPKLHGERKRLRICRKRRGRLSANRELRLHEGNALDQNKVSRTLCVWSRNRRALWAALLSAAFSSTLARTWFASLFPTTSPTLLPSTFVWFIYGRPCAVFSFLAANAALFIALLDVVGFPLLLRSVFLFASSCHTSSMWTVR